MSWPEGFRREETAMATEDADTGTEGDKPSLRQLLHAATGDRDAEAKALADRAGEDISEDDAKLAVERAHGDKSGEPKPESDVASPAGAESAREDRPSLEH
jgi:hypothetical protein